MVFYKIAILKAAFSVFTLWNPTCLNFDLNPFLYRLKKIYNIYPEPILVSYGLLEDTEITLPLKKELPSIANLPM